MHGWKRCLRRFARNDLPDLVPLAPVLWGDNWDLDRVDTSRPGQRLAHAADTLSAPRAASHGEFAAQRLVRSPENLGADTDALVEQFKQAFEGVHQERDEH